MADRLYEYYERVYLQQAELFEEAAVAGLRAAIGGFNRGYLQMLRSVAMPRQPSSHVNFNDNSSSSNQQLIHAQEEIDAARDSAQRQLATALANGFGALASLPIPSSLGVSNQPTVSGIFNRVNEQEDANGNADISDDDSVSIKSEDSSECESDYESHSDDMEIKEEAIEEEQNEMATSGNSNADSNIDNVSVKMEIESECESSDSESSSDEEEFAREQIKVENDNANAIDQLMDDSEVNNDTQDGNTANEQVDHSSDNRDEERDDSQAMDFNVNDEQQSDAETIIDEAFAQEASNEPVQSTPTLDLGSLPSTSTGRRRRRLTRSKKKVNYTVANIEDSSDGTNDDSTVNGNGKRPKRLSRKASTPKRAHVEPVGAAVVEEEETAKKLTIIVQYLKCTEKGCKKKCMDKAQLDGHLLAKHKIMKCRCKVKGCTQSFAKQDELTDHRKLAHRKLKNLPCDKCEATCKSYNDLSTHFCNYHQRGRFECSADKCDFTGKTRLQVRNHYQRKHSSAKYKCTFAHCSMSFNQKNDLTCHLRTHTHERPFACDECHKAFTQKSSLTVHKRIHSGLKLYRCKWPECEHSAITRGNVSVHVRVHHFGLPASKKQQDEQNLIDTRDAGEFIEKIIGN